MLLLIIFSSSIILVKSLIIIPLKDYPWKVQNSDNKYEMTTYIPTGIYSDLMKTYVLDDYLKGLNDVEYRWIAYDDWTYSVNFNVDQNILEMSSKELIFHGLDGTAKIYLNNKFIGNVMNTFVRYRLNTYGLQEENNLQIFFESPIKKAKKVNNDFHQQYHKNKTNPHYEENVHFLRRMQASFGTEWAPTFPSVGIWKEIELVAYENDIIIRDIMTIISKIRNEPWRLVIKVHYDVPIDLDEDINGNIESVLKTKNENEIKVTKEIELKSEESYFQEEIFQIIMSVPQDDVELWWPNGYGSQNLYDLSVSFSNGIKSNTKTVQIGFRTLQLKQDVIDINVSEKNYFSFYFVVNDIPIFAKGAALLPVDILLENSSDKKKIEYLLNSAKVSNMNMIRVPADGIYQSDYFYELCDKMGILVWQEMMFYKETFPVKAFPNLTGSIHQEIMQQIMRLQHHPSIAVWVGNNELEFTLSICCRDLKYKRMHETIKEDYETFVAIFRTIIYKLEDNRPYLLSTPSNGLEHQMENYVISNNPNSLFYGDVRKYFNSNSWSNSNDELVARFYSKYGVRSFPSLESLKEIVEVKEDLSSVNTAFMNNRQRNEYINANEEIICSVAYHFGIPDPEDLENLIFASQINQAWALKQHTERYRRNKDYTNYEGYGKTMGTLYWHLNDVWQSPTFSSIEYDGKWKMLHYYARKFFAPIASSMEVEFLNPKIHIFLISDLLENESLTVKLEIFAWNSIEPVYTIEDSVVLERLSSIEIFTNINILNTFKDNCEDPILGKKCILKLSVFDVPDGNVINTNYLLPASKSFKMIIDIPKPNITISEITCDSEKCFITIETDAIALFVWLDTDYIAGYFSDNGFIMTESRTEIQFYPKKVVTADELSNVLSIKVMDEERLQKFTVLEENEYFSKICEDYKIPKSY